MEIEMPIIGYTIQKDGSLGNLTPDSAVVAGVQTETKSLKVLITKVLNCEKILKQAA